MTVRPPQLGAVWSGETGTLGSSVEEAVRGQRVPKTIPSFGDVVKVRCGLQFSVALTKEGKVFTW